MLDLHFQLDPKKFKSLKPIYGSYIVVPHLSQALRSNVRVRVKFKFIQGQGLIYVCVHVCVLFVEVKAQRKHLTFNITQPLGGDGGKMTAGMTECNP